MRVVARQFHVSKSTVQRWVRHAAGQRLDRVDFSDRPCRPHHTRRTPTVVEDLILDLRQDLKVHSPLGEHGPRALRQERVSRGLADIPSNRTIARILERRGALDGQRRLRRPAPPKGWYLPDVAAAQAEVDGFDRIEDLRIEHGPLVDVLTAISLHGRLAQAWPQAAQATARTTLACLLGHWRKDGLPTYAQFDNDTRFQGAHQHPDVLSRVMRLCLLLGITPVFTPPRETGFQAQIENFNGRWQQVVWNRFHHAGLRDLRRVSSRFIRAFRRRHAAREDALPARRPLLEGFHLDLRQPVRGKIIYRRRTTEQGKVSLLGHVFPVDRHWPYRLVRCELDRTTAQIQFFALRRRDPTRQPLLARVRYQPPVGSFHD